MRDAPKGVHLKNRLSSITQGLIERSALFSFHPPTSVRLPLRFRVLASQKATSVPHQSEKDHQSFSTVVSYRHEGLMFENNYIYNLSFYPKQLVIPFASSHHAGRHR